MAPDRASGHVALDLRGKVLGKPFDRALVESKFGIGKLVVIQMYSLYLKVSGHL